MPGLPKNPQISPIVEVWKGVTKYAGLTAIAAMAAFGFLHHVVSGPNKVSSRGRAEREAPRRRACRMTTVYDVEKGDAVHPGDPVTVDRYTVGARINHWITAASLVLLALSGLALFHPSLFFLTGLFGGGQWTRAIHPWIGVVLFFAFLGLFLRFWKANLWEPRTMSGWQRLRDVLAGDEENLPEVGKYNAGQKLVFWVDVAADHRADLQRHRDLGPVFLRSTRRSSRSASPCSSMRWLRSSIICVWIVHVYAAIWVRGTIRAMTRGPGHRRLGVAASSQVAARAGDGSGDEGGSRRVGYWRRYSAWCHVARAVREE